MRRPSLILASLFGLVLFSTTPALAQGTQSATAVGPPSRLTRVIVAGDATVQAQPDTATINIAVVTQNKRALEAQTENANRSAEVVRVVKAAAAGSPCRTASVAGCSRSS